MRFKPRRGMSGSLCMPPPAGDHLPTPAPAPPAITTHGAHGCRHPFHGTRREPAFKSAVGHDRAVFNLLDWSCRNGLVSETQTGDMKIQIDEPWRTRLIDSLDRLSARYPSCIARSEGASWKAPCPHCGRNDYLVVVA